MDLPTSVLPEQLSLPFGLLGDTSDGPAPAPLAPADVWTTLLPPLQAACRQTLIQILQEVFDANRCEREDLAPPL